MTVTRICSEVESNCRCTADIDHDGPHLCECGGSWSYRDGEFVAVTMPGTARPGVFGDLARDLEAIYMGERADV